MTPRAKPRQRVQLDSHKDITAAHEDQSELIQVARIRTDGGTQMRAELNQEAIEDYADRYANEKPLPPLDVVRDTEGNVWLWNGFHRLAAWRMAHERINEPVPPIACNVTYGDRRDAVLKAAGANDDNGVRRTNADKRRAVELLLQDDEWRQKTDAWIAEQCKVDPKTVAAHRRRLVSNREIPESTVRQTADGRTINTAKIGTNQPKRKRSSQQAAPQPRPAPQPQPEPQPEPVQPGPVQTQFDADLQAHGYTIVCLGPGRYQWRTAGDSETGIGFGSGPIYATVYEALQDALDKIAKQQAYERAQTDAEYWAQKASRNIPEVERKAARLHNVSQVCELMLDSLTDYEQDTGDYGGSHEVRKWMRHMRETIQRHLDAYTGGKDA